MQTVISNGANDKSTLLVRIVATRWYDIYVYKSSTNLALSLHLMHYLCYWFKSYHISIGNISRRCWLRNVKKKKKLNDFSRSEVNNVTRREWLSYARGCVTICFRSRARAKQNCNVTGERPVPNSRTPGDRFELVTRLGSHYAALMSIVRIISVFVTQWFVFKRKLPRIAAHD